MAKSRRQPTTRPAPNSAHPRTNRRRRASRNGHASAGAMVRSSSTSEAGPHATVEPRPDVDERARQHEGVGELVRRRLSVERRRHRRDVEVPGRIVREGPPGRDLAGTAVLEVRGRRFGLAERVAEDAALAGQGPAAGRPEHTPADDQPDRQGRGPERRAPSSGPDADPRAPATRGDQGPGDRDPDQGRRQDEEDLGVAEEDQRRADERHGDRPRAALDERPVGHPQREQGHDQGDGLGPVAIELLVEPDGREQQDRAEQGGPAGHPPTEEQRREQQAERERDEPVELEVGQQVAGHEQHRGGGVRRHGQVVGLERPKRPPLRQLGRDGAELRHRLGEVRVVPGGRALRQQVRPGRGGGRHDDERAREDDAGHRREPPAAAPIRWSLEVRPSPSEAERRQPDQRREEDGDREPAEPGQEGAQEQGRQ